MAKIQKLIERDTEATIYPETVAEAVRFNDGRNAEQTVGQLRKELDSKPNANEVGDVTFEPTSFEDDKRLEALTGFTREELKKDLFRDLWNVLTRGYGRDDRATGFFELNGLTDITYEQAVAIVARCIGMLNTRYLDAALTDADIRTNLPFVTMTGSEQGYYFSSAIRGSQIEVLNLECFNNPRMPFKVLSNCCWMLQSSKLRKVMGVIEFDSNINSYIFFNGVGENLVEVKFKGVRSKFDLNSARSISAESLAYMVENATNTSAIVVTVHPEVYAKLTDGTNAEWHAILEAATARNIQFASA